MEVTRQPALSNCVAQAGKRIALSRAQGIRRRGTGMREETVHECDHECTNTCQHDVGQIAEQQGGANGPAGRTVSCAAFLGQAGRDGPILQRARDRLVGFASRIELVLFSLRFFRFSRENLIFEIYIGVISRSN